jgi:hypothetical protein
VLFPNRNDRRVDPLPAALLPNASDVQPHEPYLFPEIGTWIEEAIDAPKQVPSTERTVQDSRHPVCRDLACVLDGHAAAPHSGLRREEKDRPALRLFGRLGMDDVVSVDVDELGERQIKVEANFALSFRAKVAGELNYRFASRRGLQLNHKRVGCELGSFPLGRH